VSLTQALLQGRGSDVNLAAVRQARLDTAFSLSELQGFTENLVAQVELACWDYLLAIRRVAIVESSLKIAETQLDEVRERISVGRMAEIELAAAEAEVALRRESLINARSSRDAGRLKLLRLLNPPGAAALGADHDHRRAGAPADAHPVSDHVALALRRRRNSPRRACNSSERPAVCRPQRLLPRSTCSSRSAPPGTPPRSGSLDIRDGRDLRRADPEPAARQQRRPRRQRRAVLSRRQAGVPRALVRSTCAASGRGRAPAAIAATAAPRLQEEKLRAETEKFRVGQSTAFLVAQAQRDLLQAENDAVSAAPAQIPRQCYRLEDAPRAPRHRWQTAETDPSRSTLSPRCARGLLNPPEKHVVRMADYQPGRTAMSKTEAHLQEAFAGESQANRTYLAFAVQAERDGHPAVARLFRAAAQAETVHALAHLRALGGVHDTAANLRAAIGGETHEFTAMYPRMIADADAGGPRRRPLVPLRQRG
jgi:hypothetical protein